MHSRWTLRTTAAALAVLGLTACTGGTTTGAKGPAVVDFTEGPCRLAAPAVLALRAAGHKLPTAPGSVPSEVQKAVITAQDELQPSTTGTDEIGKAALAISQQAGFVRLQAVGNSYDPKTGAALLAEVDAFVSRCTTPAPSKS